MALKAEELNLVFDVDEFTWGDLLDIKSGDYAKFLDVCGRLGTIEGKTQAEVINTLRQLRVEDINKIDTLLGAAIEARTNPTDETEKN